MANAFDEVYGKDTAEKPEKAPPVSAFDEVFSPTPEPAAPRDLSRNLMDMAARWGFRPGDAPTPEVPTGKDTAEKPEKAPPVSAFDEVFGPTPEPEIEVPPQPAGKPIAGYPRSFYVDPQASTDYVDRIRSENVELQRTHGIPIAHPFRTIATPTPAPEEPPPSHFTDEGLSEKLGVPVESVQKYRAKLQADGPVDFWENIKSETPGEMSEKLIVLGDFFTMARNKQFRQNAESLDQMTKELGDIKSHAQFWLNRDDLPLVERRKKFFDLMEEYRQSAETVAGTKSAKFMREYLDRRAEAMIRGKTTAAKIGSGIANLPKYMGEFIITGGLYGAGKRAGLKLAAKWGIKGSAAAALVGAAVGTGARMSVLWGNFVAQGGKRLLPNVRIDADGVFHVADSDKSAFGSYLGAFANQYLELLTEMSGEAFAKGLSKLMPKTSAVLEAWRIGKPASVVAWHGMPAEFFEEGLSKFTKSLATSLGIDTGEKDWVMGLEEAMITLGVLAVPTATAALRGEINTVVGKVTGAEKLPAGAAAFMAEQTGLAEGAVQSAVQRAKKRKGDFRDNFVRELTDEAQVSTEGLGAWARENPAEAEALASIEKPTRKDFDAAGLPRRPGKDRARVSATLGEILSATPQQEPPAAPVETVAVEPPVEPVSPEPAPVEPPTKPKDPRVGEEGVAVAEVELYGRLGVAVDATAEEIHAAARARMAAVHPDVGGDVEAFKGVQEADRILTDPKLREQYDKGGLAGAEKAQRKASARADLDTLVRAAKGFGIPTGGRTRQDIAADVAKARRSGRKAKPAPAEKPPPAVEKPAKKKGKKVPVEKPDHIVDVNKKVEKPKKKKGLKDKVEKILTPPEKPIAEMSRTELSEEALRLDLSTAHYIAEPTFGHVQADIDAVRKARDEAQSSVEEMQEKLPDAPTTAKFVRQQEIREVVLAFAVEPAAAKPKTSEPKPEPVKKLPDATEAESATSFDVALPNSKDRVSGRWRVVDASQVATSAETDYDQSLQPRNRESVASREQISEMAAGLDPAQLGESAIADTGAPFVDSNGHIVSGNGRIEAIREAYRQDKAGAYGKFVAEQAKKLGIDVEGVKNPILVREITDTGKLDMPTVAEKANQSTILERSEAELAEADAKAIVDNNLLKFYAPSETGDIRAATNNQFLERFIEVTGAQGLRKSDGSFSAAIDNRVRRAMLGAILGQTEGGRDVVRRAIEQADELGLKRILDGIMIVGGELLHIGKQKPTFDLSADLAAAVDQLLQYKQGFVDGKVKTPGDWAKQGNLFGEGMTDNQRILFHMLATAKSMKAVVEYLGDYVKAAGMIEPGGALFGEDVGPKSVQDLLKGIEDEREKQGQDRPEPGLFEEESDEAGRQDEADQDTDTGGPDTPADGGVSGAASGSMSAASEEDSFAERVVEPPAEVKKRADTTKKTIPELVDGLLEIISPASRGLAGRAMDLIRRRRTAEAAQRSEVVRAKLHAAGKKVRWMSPDDVVEFIDRMEDPAGARPQDTAELDEIAALLREMMDRGTSQVQAYGVLEEYIENYFPHHFKRPDQNRDVIAGLLSKRQLTPKGFLKKRKYLRLKDGLEAGLELAIDNPVEMVILRLDSMHRYMAGMDIIADLKHLGYAVFVPSSLEKNYKRAEWEFVDDPSLIVRTTPKVTLKEAYDKLLVDQLMGVATMMGVSHERVVKMSGRKWGQSGPGKNIKTRYAGPVSVLAHEIGHQIGDQYGLYNHMLHGEHTVGRRFMSGKKKGQPVKKDQTANRAAIKKEFRALADLRGEGQDVSKARLRYLRVEAEKEAVILEAWLAAPGKMAEVAPLITAEWKAFLASEATLAPLLNLDRSVVLGSRKQTLELGGVLELGKWALPKQAATVLRNHLSPGLSSHRNIWVRGVYDGLRKLRNISLMLSHGMSGFHGINVGTDSINSHSALAWQKLGRGDWRGALKMLRSVPAAPVADYFLGGKVIEAMRSGDPSGIPDPIMRSVVEAVIRGGGTASMNAAYQNNAFNGMVQSVRDVMFSDKTGKQIKGAVMAPLHAAMALVEASAAPIMKYEVPHLKMGVFFHMAKDIYENASRRGWDDTKISREMAKAWDNVDNRMGQLNYDNLNWGRTMKEIIMLLFRAPGWTLGSIREFGGGAWDLVTVPWRIGKNEDVITSKMGYAVGAGISYAVQGMIIQYLFTGEPPEEAKDLYFPRTGRKNPDGSNERLSMPHYSKDIVAWLTNPLKTVQHKMNPFWGTALDLWANEDYFGRQIREGTLTEQAGQAGWHFVNNMFMPFSVRNAFRLNENGESVVVSVIIGATGISPAPAYITRTPAQKMMIGYLRDRSGSRRVSQEDADKSDRRRRLIRDLRSGKTIPGDSDRWAGFTDTQRRGIVRDSKQTAFQTSFKRLSFDEAVNVFTVASKVERLAAWDLLLKKRVKETVPDPGVLAVYYELKLTQAQVDKQVAADVQVIRNAAWGLSAKDLSPTKRDELLRAMRDNKQYEADFQFAAFRHRWLWTLKGKRSGRKIGTKAYWQRIRRLRTATSPESK